MDDQQLLLKMKEGVSRFGRYIGMALILGNREDPASVRHNATISFLSTGERRLLVTSAHVIEAFEQVQAEHRNAILAVTCGTGKQPIDITSAPVVDRIRSGGVDLATLEFEHHDLFEQAGKAFFEPNVWPPPRATEGDIAFLVGFPELHREVSDRGLECRVTPICDFVTAVSDRKVTLADEKLKRRVLTGNPHLPSFGSLSGMSGCPAFIQRDGESKWNLSGFMYEASQNDHHAFICINHADFIQEDGRIDRSRIL